MARPAPHTTSPGSAPAHATILGIETEYGIGAPDAPDVQPEFLATAVVASCPGPATGTDLDWTELNGYEDAHNRVLGNGARFYVDHAHPEYSGPEVTNPLDAVRFDAAGDGLVLQAAQAAGERLGFPVKIFKNNTDGKGASYGCHENYLLARATAWPSIVAHLPTFLVSRQVFTGAGRVGLGQRNETPGFQLAQRADFFETVESLETTRRRPIVNTRDEPHAPRERFRRLHVIAGDANRSQFATYLKAGTTAAMLAALEAGVLPELTLADPLGAVRTVSRDLTCRALLPLADGRRLTAIDLQQAYLDAVAALDSSIREAPDDRLLKAWQTVLDDLRRDPASCADRLDWVAKWQLLERFRARERASWEAPRLAELDLKYADLDPATSVFAALQRAGACPDLLAPEKVAEAIANPPSDTRAYLRGQLVTRFPDAVVAASWESVTLRTSAGRFVTIPMGDPAGSTQQLTASVLATARTADDVARTLGR